MFDELKKIPVFIGRDFRLLFAYKLAFSTTFITLLFTFFHLVLFGNMFGSGSVGSLDAYGGDFISYILVGSIGWSFLWSIMAGTSESLRSEMTMGTLESILLTSTKITTIMMSYAIFGCLFGLLSAIILIGIGFLAFGISIFATATIYTFIILALSSTMMMGFGLIFGGLTIWLKNIGETIPLLQNIFMFFCGVYFPITVLPEFLQPVHKYLPFYYSIEGLRLSFLPTTSNSEIIEFILILFVLSIILIIIGIYTLHKGLTKAKKDGSLAFY